MKNYVQLHSADGPAFEIPLDHWRTEDPYQRSPFDDDLAPPVVSTDRYFADHPARPKDLNITEARFYSDTLEKPIRFILESFILLGGEEGLWTLTIKYRDYGPPDCELEYYATKQFGKRVRKSTVFQWNHDKDQMVGN